MECEVDVKIGQVEAKGGKRKPRGVRRQGRRANWPGRSGANLRPRCPQEGSRSAPVGLQREPYGRGPMGPRPAPLPLGGRGEGEIRRGLWASGRVDSFAQQCENLRNSELQILSF